MIAPVWRSSPTRGLEIIYDLPPIDLVIRETALNTHLRIRKDMKITWDGLGRTTKKGHIRMWDDSLAELGLTVGAPFKPYKQWDRNFSVPKFENTEHNDCESGSIWYVYTDGSKADTNTGCGYVIRKRGKFIATKSYQMDDRNTVFQAEVAAINQACKNMAYFTEAKIVFRVDSQAALQAIKNTEIHDPLVDECIKNLNKLGSSNIVRVQWIRAHCGHLGNEAADEAARKGGLGSGLKLSIDPPNSSSKNIVKSHVTDLWTKRWQSAKIYKQTRIFFPEPNEKIVKMLNFHSRKTIGFLVGFCTGHCCLNYHAHKADEDLSPLCRFCGEDDEKPIHLFRDCPKPELQSKRVEIFQTLIPPRIPSWKPDQMLRFLRETSIWEALKWQG